MPLTIHQLNADTTFLLTYTPTTTHHPSYTILLDPWLTGPSAILHPSFAVSRHTTPSAIQSLTELDKPPDLVIVSQPKSDHCNKGTLCTLPKNWEGTIAAVPAAAKKIRAWKYFADAQIVVVPAYNFNDGKTVIRLPLGDAQDAVGEVTVANIPTPYDLSAVHNAIAITLPTPNSKPLTILYAPHGLAASLLKPYFTHHPPNPKDSPLIDLFFHSLNTEANPTLLGGVISNGAPGGIDIVKEFGARCWISAHDEVKDNGGVATLMVKCRVYGVAEVEGMLRAVGCMGTGVYAVGNGEVLELGGGREEGDEVGDEVGVVERVAGEG